MNLLTGLFNPLEMYLSIAQMDDEKAKVKTKRIMIVTAVVAVLLSLMPVFIVNVPVEQYILSALINNSQMFGYCVLLPLISSLMAKYFTNKELKNNKISAEYTNFSKTFLIIMTSITYIIIASLAIMFEITIFVSFTMSNAPHIAMLIIPNLILITVFVESVLMFIWYVYKPFSAIYQTTNKATLKRISIIVVANLIAVFPCNAISMMAHYQYGLESVSTNTMTKPTLHRNTQNLIVATGSSQKIDNNKLNK